MCGAGRVALRNWHPEPGSPLRITGDGLVWIIAATAEQDRRQGKHIAHPWNVPIPDPAVNWS